ncbi:MAG: amidohydrolase, partial [Firmicutes bacterium]|nr:amidohydrolase [Bacillota bacterium]
VVGFLAEYDALPGVGHGCGHNIIGTAAAGAALAVKRAAELAGGLPGTVLVVGCPAEEGGVEGAGGKVILVEAGVFEGVDAALMVHPANVDAPSGTSSCRLALEIAFTGKAAHAAGAPHEGVNALEAVIQTFNALNALRQHLPQAVRVHGIVVKGGEAPNVVPDTGVIRLYVRAPTLAELEPAAERVRDCARGAAMATGCTVAFREFARTYLDLRVNEPLEKTFGRNMSDLGRPLGHPANAGRGTGSTDMGNVSHVVPAIHPYVAITDRPGGAVSHSREFAEATVSPAGEAALLVAAKALAMTCLDLMLSPETLAAVREAGPRRRVSAASLRDSGAGETYGRE